MYGFLLRPKWLAFHILVFGSVALMISLGFWQLRRLDERKEFNALVTERIDQPPVPLDSILDDVESDPSAYEWRQVTMSGTWLPGQVIWFNRTQDGATGDNVLTALDGSDGTDGTTVIVNRGFVSVAEVVTDPPTGEVRVLGRIRTSQEHQRGGLTDSTTGPLTEIRRVDVARLAPQLPGDVAPFYLDLVDSIPPIAETAPLPTPLPTLDEGPHLSYAVQWFIFSIAVIVGWVLAIRKSLATRRRQLALTDEAGEPGSEDFPASTLDASTTTST